MKTLRSTHLGSIVKINGQIYIVCVYRSNTMVQVVSACDSNRTKLMSLDTIIEEV